jgi:hypothetical protein
MNIGNPLEVMLVIFMALLSIWFIERIIAGAFKTAIAVIFIIIIVLGYDYFFNKNVTEHKHEKPLPKFNIHDLTDYSSFETKFDLYKEQAIKDIKQNYYDAKKEIKQNNK